MLDVQVKDRRVPRAKEGRLLKHGQRVFPVSGDNVSIAYDENRFHYEDRGVEKLRRR
jgi:hypothetical protein